MGDESRIKVSGDTQTVEFWVPRLTAGRIARLAGPLERLAAVSADHPTIGPADLARRTMMRPDVAARGGPFEPFLGLVVEGATRSGEPLPTSFRDLHAIWLAADGIAARLGSGERKLLREAGTPGLPPSVVEEIVLRWDGSPTDVRVARGGYEVLDGRPLAQVGQHAALPVGTEAFVHRYAGEEDAPEGTPGWFERPLGVLRKTTPRGPHLWLRASEGDSPFYRI